MSVEGLTIKGLPYQPHNSDYVYDRTNGTWSRVDRWFGVYNYLLNLLAPLKASNYYDRITLDAQPGDPMAELAAYRGTIEQSETPVNVWELLGNDIERSIDLNPNVSAHGLSTSDLQDIDRKLADSEAVQFPPGSFKQTFYETKLRGDVGDLVSQYVLRKTQTVSSAYTVKIGYAGVGKIWTPAQILATEVIPVETLFALDQIPLPDTPAGYISGWFKKSPTLTKAAFNRSQITQEWWLTTSPSWQYQYYQL